MFTGRKFDFVLGRLAYGLQEIALIHPLFTLSATTSEMLAEPEETRMVDWPDERTVGVVLYPHVDLLAVAAPVHALGMLQGVFDCVLLAASEDPVRTTQNIALTPASTFEDACDIDLLVVPGGAGARELVRDEGAMTWLADASSEAELILTISTGSVMLAATGSLDGRRATTSARALPWAQEVAPRVAWESHARFVDEGSVVSAAGVGAGLDATLHLISRLTANDVGDNIARSLEHVRIKDASEDPFSGREPNLS